MTSETEKDAAKVRYVQTSLPFSVPNWKPPEVEPGPAPEPAVKCHGHWFRKSPILTRGDADLLMMMMANADIRAHGGI